MPIHDLGYRRWTGKLTPESSRCLVIAETGARRVWQSGWVRRILFFAWLPLLVFGGFIAVYERAAHGDTALQGFVAVLGQGVGYDALLQQPPPASTAEGDSESDATEAAPTAEGDTQTDAAEPNPTGEGDAQPDGTEAADPTADADAESDGTEADPMAQQGGWPAIVNNDPTAALNENRHTAWTLILYYYLRGPQGVAMVLLVGLIAPRLISEDVETRAFLFYFSRPLSRLEYLTGKSMTVWLFIAAITALPALFMYLLGIVLSPSADVVYDTWGIPFRIILASISVIVPATALALCFSSLTKESRYAGFAWFAVWVLGMVAYAFIAAVREAQGGGGVVYEEYFSLYHTFGAVQRWILGIDEFGDAKYFVLSLVLITTACLLIMFRRVSAPMRA